MKKKICGEMKFAVDIPNQYGEEWVNIEYFETKKEAIKFAQKTFGADKSGKVCLVSSL